MSALDPLPVSVAGWAALAAGAMVLAYCLYWRLSCQKKTIPWPHQLAFWLENPFMVVFCNKNRLATRLDALLATGQNGNDAEQARPRQVLDLGCGAGRVLVPFAKICQNRARIVAADMQPQMLAKAEAACRQQDLNNVEFRRLTLHPPYTEPLGRFDLIYLVTVLGEIPKLAEVLVLLYRSLSPGGRLSITETLPDPCYVTSRRVRQAGEDAGFAVLAIRHGVMSYTVEFAKQS